MTRARLSMQSRALRPVVVLVGIALTAFGCGRGQSESPTPPSARYPCAAAQGVDPDALERARASLASHRQTRCMLVERNGVIVMEEYFNGADADDFFDVRSVTKSITSALVGVAIEQGRIRSLDQTVGESLDPVVPDIAAAQRAITLRQLLTMTSGLPWHELNSSVQDYFAWTDADDPLRWILEKPFEHAPGTRWHYNTAASHLASAMLTRATGATARVFAQENQFGPLGSTVGKWPADGRGYNYGGHGISLQARTMLKFGRLYLDEGVYQGKRIVAADWIRQSTTAHHATETAMPFASGYGYFFWTDRDPRTGLSYYFATGYGGQFLINVPEANATIVATTEWRSVADASVNWYFVMRTTVENVLPSFPFPAGPTANGGAGGTARLQSNAINGCGRFFASPEK